MTWDRRVNGSPFRGLASFDASHSAVFFGRDDAVEQIAAKLRTARFVLVIGASGVGKSSLLRAGLIPRVTGAGAIASAAVRRSAVVTATDMIFSATAQALADEACFGVEFGKAGLSVERLTALLRGGGEPALAPIRAALAAGRDSSAVGSDTPHAARFILAVDQLERLFVEASSEEAEAFAVLLRDLTAHDLAIVVAAMRSDAYGAFQAIETFAALREKGAMHDLLPPSPAEIEEIINRPVLACDPKLAFETAADGRSLGQVIAADAQGGDVLPLLQMTLQHLFDAEKKRGDGLLHFADYRGLDQAPVEVIAAALAPLDQAARDSVSALIIAFAHGVELDPASGKPVVTLRPIVREAFERGRKERRALIKSLIAHRLLVTETAGDEIRIRPMHDALLRIWPEAVHTLIENATIVRVRRVIEPLAARWTAAGRPARSNLLLRSPALLADAQRLLSQFGDDVTPALQSYLAASQGVQAKQVEYEQYRQRLNAPGAGAKYLYASVSYRLLVLALIALTMIVRYLDPAPLERLRTFAFDTFQRESPAPYDPQSPVRIVNIDEPSLAAYGPWPWPRTRLGDLARALTERGAAAVVFDLRLSMPDRWSPEEYLKTLPPDQAQLLRSAIGEGPTNDHVFAKSLELTPSVVAVRLDAVAPQEPPDPVALQQCLLDPLGKAGFAWAGTCPEPFIPNFRNAEVLSELARAAPGLGAVAYLPDADGVLRRLGLVDRQGDRLIPALAVEAIRIAHGVNNYVIGSSKPAGKTSIGEQTGIEYFDIGELQVDTDPQGAIMPRFRQANPAQFISAGAVLAGKSPKADLTGKIVVVGTTAGGVPDLHMTPIDEAVPGIEIQAQTIENLLAHTELTRPGYALVVEELMVLGIGALLGLTVPLLSTSGLSVLCGATLISFAAGSWAAYNYSGVLIDPIYPIVTLAVLVIALKLGIRQIAWARRGTTQ